MTGKRDLSVYQYRLGTMAIAEVRELLLLLDAGASGDGVTVDVAGEDGGRLQLSPGFVELLLRFVGTMVVKDGAVVFIADRERDLPAKQINEMIGRPRGDSATQLMQKRLGHGIGSKEPFLVRTGDFVDLLREAGHPIVE